MTKREIFNETKNSSAQKERVVITIMLCIFGVVLALLSNLGCPCSGQTLSPVQKSFWGVPIVYIGILGYITFAITAVLKLWKYFFFLLHGALTVGGVFAVILLVYRSFSLSYFCPFCLFCWIINCALFQMFLFEYSSLKQKEADFKESFV